MSDVSLAPLEVVAPLEIERLLLHLSDEPSLEARRQYISERLYEKYTRTTP